MSDSTIIIPQIDLKRASDEIIAFIRETVDHSGVNGVVVGLSGGVDSSLTATLCVKALGEDKVLGVLMPVEFTPRSDNEDALELAKWLGITTEVVDVQSLYESFSRTLNIGRDIQNKRMPMANVLARIRMIVLYYYANLKKLLVVGTGDRSESLIGYFTKHGDGGVDFLPISHLYKTHVRELAIYLGVPEKIALKPSSPQLYPGHRATDEIIIDYSRLDPVLIGLFDLGLPVERVSLQTDVPLDIVKSVQLRYNSSRHKRAYPPALRRKP
jgi:NAD+ synthase